MTRLFAVIKENFRKDRMMFAIRIVTGVILAILTADKFGVEFAPTTGVITLLTVDKTKKATFRRIVYRLISFVYTYIISWMTVEVFHLETTIGFSLAITLVTFITFLLRWDITLSVNCVVLIQLFLNSKPFTWSLFINESERILIGLLAAVLVNFVFGVKYDDTEEENVSNNN